MGSMLIDPVSNEASISGVSKFKQSRVVSKRGNSEKGVRELRQSRRRREAMAAAAQSRCLLVTGSPGVGKTTLIVRVLESLKNAYPNLKVQGFYTREIREGNERVGFEVVTIDGRTGRLASNRLSSSESLRWPMVGKYRVDVASFESLALPELQIKDDTDLFVIDEVGKMELYSSFFYPAVLRVLESKIPLLATIPLPKSGVDIPGVARLRNHAESTVFTLNTSNRDSMKEQIYSSLVDLLQKR